MVILMPKGKATDVLILEDYLKQDSSAENMLDVIDTGLDDPNATSNEVELTMPEFNVQGDIDVKHILQMVRLRMIS